MATSTDESTSPNTGPVEPLNFITFLEEHARVEHADTHEVVPFKLWEHQKQVAAELESGQWLLILKARQLGFTWLLAAYAIWLTHQPRRRVLVFFQDKEYASDFLDHCRFINDNLPAQEHRKPSTDNRVRLEFDNGSYIRALAATKRAGHSISANLLICDEAAFIRWLNQILRGAKPTLETQGGQAVVLSTSNGPTGDFYELWQSLKPAQEKTATETERDKA